MIELKRILFIALLIGSNAIVAQKSNSILLKEENQKIFFEGTKMVSQKGRLVNKMKEGLWITYFPS
jgi:hypothetical protein